MAKIQGSYASITKGVSQQQPADRVEGQHGEQVNLISDPVRGLVRRNGFVFKDAEYAVVAGSIADAQADSYSFRCYPFQASQTDYDLLYRTRAVVGGAIGANHLYGLHCFNKTPRVGQDPSFIPVVAPSAIDDPVWPDFLEGGFSAVSGIGRYVLLAGNDILPTATNVDAWGATANQRSAVAWVRGGGYSRTYTVKARRGTTGITYNASYTTKAAAYQGAFTVDNILSQAPNFQKNSVDILNVKTFTAPETAVSFDAATNYFVNGIGNDARRAAGTGAIFRIFQRVAGVDDLTKYIDIKILSLRPSNLGFIADIISVVGGPWSINGTTDVARLYDHDENENYSVDLNNQTSAYNEAVNQWTAEAAADIVPSNIAEQLRLALIAAGFPGWLRIGSHIYNDDCDYLQVGDSSDGDFIVALSNETRAADEVTPIHKVGKIVKVSPKGNEVGAYYLEAFPRTAGNADTYQTVTWRESAGVVQTPTLTVAVGTVENETFYVASTPARLRALVLASEAVTLDLLDFSVSAAGDLESNAPPPFYEQPITSIFLFQDRLCFAAGAALALSKTGDYFNFYRSTVLTLPDDDPISGFALGSEGDSIRKAILYDRNLLLMGDKAIYNVSGRSVQTPTTFNIAVQLNVDNTSLAQPVGAGQNVSFLKEDTQLAASRMLQVRAGLFQDSPVVDDASKQLRDYINGTPAEMVSLVSPDVVFVRTEFFLRTANGYPRARPWGLYVYHYLDQPDGTRVTDSWSAWEWSSTLGTPVGISPSLGGDGIWMYTLAFGTDETGAASRALTALTVSARPDPTGLPYLDGLRLGDAAELSGLWTPAAPANVQAVVYTTYGAGYSYGATPSNDDAQRLAGLTHPHYTLGDGPPEEYDALRWQGLQGWYSDAVTAFGASQDDNLYTGLAFPCYVDLTNPFVRTREGRANTLGRLTLTKLRVATARTAGFKATFIDYEGQRTTVSYGGEYHRYRHDTNVWVGRDVQHVQVRLEANLWYPLSITAIEWQGQWFTNSRRVS